MIEVLDSASGQHWSTLLASLTHDFYHLHEYHALAELAGQGSVRLIVYREGGCTLLWPFLLRRLAHKGGCGPGGVALHDVTSVYGYCGPVSSHSTWPLGLQQHMRAELGLALRDLGVVSVFSRLHPLLTDNSMLVDMGEVAAVGPTVSIDLTDPVERQWRDYRENHKRDISRLCRLGVECAHDATLEHLDDFSSIYSETMTRLSASEEYLFPAEYFRGLANALGERLHLFYCTHEGRIACAGLFTLCCGIVQYHLSGAREWAAHLAPTKLMIDTVRVWATEQGAHTFHLGGGVGAREDSLFNFKAGFSPRRHTFKVWKWIVMPDEYRALCRAREERARAHGFELAPTSYFPEYRAPIVSPHWES